MKKICMLLMLMAAPSLCLPSSAQAQTTKTITLKDGSNLKGQVIAVENGVYTINTPHLGEIKLNEEDILNIGTQPVELPQDKNLKGQVMQLQNSVLSDPALMADIENLMEDESIRAILSDPNFVNDILSYDQDKIQQNENTQYLLQNPGMKALMEKVHRKVSP